MRLELLGTVAVVGTDGTRVEVRAPRPARLLGALALEHPRPLDRAELVELLWPETEPVDAARAVRQVVSRARAAIVEAGGSPAMVRSSDGATELAIDDLVVDVRRAIDDVAAAERQLADGDLGGADRAALGALDLLQRGLAISDDVFVVVAWRERVASAVSRARLVVGHAALGRGRGPAAIEHAEMILSRDAFDEGAVRLLMRAHAASGRRAAALAAYERHRRLLDDELGVRPSPQTEQLHVELLGAAPDAVTTAPTRPATLAGRIARDALPFVGRAGERRVLEAAFEWVEREQTQRIVLVGGDAGAGKTRLVAEVAATLAAPVAWGRCPASGATAFAPFGDIVAQIATARVEIVGALGRQLDDLALLVPELGAGPTDRPVDARDRVFRAVVTAVRAAAVTPLVCVLDDLQWGSADTLALLARLVDATADCPALWIVIAREATDDAAAALAELRRLPQTRAVGVDGLAAADVVALLDRSAVATDSDTARTAQRLIARTAGNALFVTEFVRDAQLATRPLDTEALPRALAEIVAARCEALDPGRRALAELAAVAGSDLDVALLEQCTGDALDVVLDRLDGLRARRLLDERGVDSFAFSHDLVRDAVLAGIGPTRAARLHERVGDALAELGAAPERIAYHLVHAGPRARTRAASWSYRAGHAAALRGAWRAAADHLHWTVAHTATDRERIAASVELGRVQRALGDVASARQTVRAAIDEARAIGDAELVADATLALVGGGGRGVALDLADAERAALLAAALDDIDATEDAPPALVVALLGELALALVLTDEEARRVQLCDRALAIARASRDVTAVAGALQTRRVALMGPRGTRARAADARELLALPSARVPHERRVFAQLGLMEDLVELGDRAGARAALAAAGALVAELPHPYWAWATDAWRVLDAVIDGRVDDAEALAYVTFGHLEASEHPEAFAALGVQLTNIRLLQGRAGEMIEALRAAADANPHIPCYRAVLALCAAEAGDHRAACDALTALQSRGPTFGLPNDSNWLLAVAVLADAVATIGATEAAPPLRDLLSPYADRHIVLNCYGGGGAYWGPVMLSLARLHALLGDIDAAHEAFRGAAAAAAAFDAPWWVTRADQLRDATSEPARASRNRSTRPSQSSGSRAPA